MISKGLNHNEMLKSISRKFADPKGKALRACKETGLLSAYQNQVLVYLRRNYL